MAIDRTIEWSVERASIAVLSGDATLSALEPTILRPYQDQGDDDPPVAFVGALSSAAPDGMEGTPFRDVEMCILIETDLGDDTNGSDLHDLMAAVRAAYTSDAIAAAMAEFADIDIKGLVHGPADIDHDGDDNRRRARMEYTVQCHSV